MRPLALAAFNAPRITSGREPVGNGEVLLDAALAAGEDLAIGEQIELVVAGRRHAVEIVGLGFDFSDCLYPTCDPVHAWIDSDTWPSLVGGASGATMIAAAVDGSETEAIEHVRRRIGSGLLGSNHWSDTRADLLTETEFFGVFVGVFGLFMLVTSAVVIAGEIAARAASRRRMLGLYKSIGFTAGQLRRATVIEHLGVALVASVAGSALAQTITPRLRIGSLRIIESGNAAFDVAQMAACVAVVGAVVAISSAVPAWRASRLDVMTALDDTTQRRNVGRGRPAVATWLSLPATMAVATANARRGRTLTSVSAIAIAIVVAVCSLGIQRSVDAVVLDPAMAGSPAHATLSTPDELAAPTIEARLRSLETSTWYSFTDDTARVDGADIRVRAIGGPAAQSAFEIGEGRPLSNPGDAVVGYGMIRDFGWRIGDTIDAEIDGSVLSLEIVGWYRDTEDLGRVLQIGIDDYRAVRPGVLPDYGVLDRAEDPRGLVSDLEALFGPDARVQPNGPDTAAAAPFRAALTTMTILIAGVALAHFGGSVLTTSRERRRRFGIQRSLGFDDGQLRREAAWYGALTAALAVLIGVPLGWLAQRTIVDTLTSEVGVGPGLAIGPSPSEYVAIVGAVLLLTCGASLASTPTFRNFGFTGVSRERKGMRRADRRGGRPASGGTG
jgi:putative ABC transport system permease protein